MPRTKAFNIPQSRGRIYLLMIHESLGVDHGQMRGVLHLITAVLPKAIETGSTVEQVRKYVRTIHDSDELIECPPSKARSRLILLTILCSVGTWPS